MVLERQQRHLLSWLRCLPEVVEVMLVYLVLPSNQPALNYYLQTDLNTLPISFPVVSLVITTPLLHGLFRTSDNSAENIFGIISVCLKKIVKLFCCK